MKELINWLSIQFSKGKFFTELLNTKDISDPIVKAIQDKEYETLDPNSIQEPIVSAVEDATRAIESIKIPEFPSIPEVDFSEVVLALKDLLKKDTNVTVKQGDTKVTVDTKSLLSILKKIESKKPEEQIDYTPILSDLCDLVEGKNVDLSKIEKFLDEFKFPVISIPTEDGRVKVTLPDEELAKMRSHFVSSDHLVNKNNDRVNPATEEKQDAIVSAIEGISIDLGASDIQIGAVELKNSTDDTRAVVGANGLEVEVKAMPSGLATSANQLPDGHEVEVNNFPSEYPLPAAQITTLTPPAAITGFATSANQLPDNHQVTVSNPTTSPETGLAKATQQNSQIALETTLNSLTETLQELVQRLAPLAGAMSNAASLRVTPGAATLPISGSVTASGGGYITSAQSIAEKNVLGVLFPEKIALTNLTAIQSNLNNISAK
jgi:hypothetical protein